MRKQCSKVIKVSRVRISDRSPYKPKPWLYCNNRVRRENYNAHSKERSNSMAVSLQLTKVWCYDESVGAWVSRTLNLGFIFKVASTVSWLNFGVWLSLVERSVWDRNAAGSNPATPTTGLVYLTNPCCRL